MGACMLAYFCNPPLPDQLLLPPPVNKGQTTAPLQQMMSAAVGKTCGRNGICPCASAGIAKIKEQVQQNILIFIYDIDSRKNIFFSAREEKTNRNNNKKKNIPGILWKIVKSVKFTSSESFWYKVHLKAWTHLIQTGLEANWGMSDKLKESNIWAKLRCRWQTTY